MGKFDDFNERYEKLTAMQLNEFHKGIQRHNWKDIKDPEVADLVKNILIWQEEDDNMKQKTDAEVKPEQKTKVEPGTETGKKQEATHAIVERDERKWTIQEVTKIGEYLYKSRYFEGVGNESQAIAKILAGKELGIPPVTALSKIFLVNGKVAVQSEIMADLIKRGEKYNYRVKKLDDTRCEIIFYEHGKEAGISTFTLEDARKAGVLKKDVWQKYPRNLLFARALSNGARWYCPDAIHGVYAYEEMGLETDARGQVIESAPVVEVAGGTPEKEKKKEVKETLIKERKEILKKLEKYGITKAKKIKKELKLEGKIIDAPENIFQKFCQEMKK